MKAALSDEQAQLVTLQTQLTVTSNQLQLMKVSAAESKALLEVEQMERSSLQQQLEQQQHRDQLNVQMNVQLTDHLSTERHNTESHTALIVELRKTEIDGFEREAEMKVKLQNAAAHELHLTAQIETLRVTMHERDLSAAAAAVRSARNKLAPKRLHYSATTHSELATCEDLTQIELALERAADAWNSELKAQEEAGSLRVELRSLKHELDRGNMDQSLLEHEKGLDVLRIQVN